jgi:hypothetical protein
VALTEWLVCFAVPSALPSGPTFDLLIMVVPCGGYMYTALTRNYAPAINVEDRLSVNNCNPPCLTTTIISSPSTVPNSLGSKNL